jgi:hypothetical protein
MMLAGKDFGVGAKTLSHSGDPVTSQHAASHELVNAIASELAAGKPVSEIEAALVQQGCDPPIARQLVSRVHSEVRKARGKATLKSWGFLIAAFVGINIILYVSQEIAAADEKHAAEAVESDLARINDQIATVERRIQEANERSNQIDALGARLESRQADFASNAEYRSTLTTYNQMVESWNDALPQLQAMQEGYDSLISTYNRRVEEYNRLAKKAYSRWWLLPIPLPRGAARATRPRSP